MHVVIRRQTTDILQGGHLEQLGFDEGDIAGIDPAIAVDFTWYHVFPLQNAGIPLHTLHNAPGCHETEGRGDAFFRHHNAQRITQRQAKGIKSHVKSRFITIPPLGILSQNPRKKMVK